MLGPRREEGGSDGQTMRLWRQDSHSKHRPGARAERIAQKAPENNPHKGHEAAHAHDCCGDFRPCYRCTPLPAQTGMGGRWRGLARYENAGEPQIGHPCTDASIGYGPARKNGRNIDGSHTGGNGLHRPYRMHLDGDLETREALDTMSARYSVKSILHSIAAPCLAVVCLVGACSAGIISAQVDVYDLHMRGLMGALASNASDIQVTGQKTFPNPAVVAWIDVDGTQISYPVAQPTSTMAADYYLHHDIDGTPHSLGCPYIDRRSSKDGQHVVVYAHHLASSPVLFGELANRYQQDAFDKLGNATWRSVEDGKVARTTIFQPLCTLHVPASYEAIQRFSFISIEDMKAWLTELAREASACTENWQTAISGAQRVLSLITCTEGNGHSMRRTIVIFVSGDQSEAG